MVCPLLAFHASGLHPFKPTFLRRPPIPISGIHIRSRENVPVNSFPYAAIQAAPLKAMRGVKGQYAEGGSASTHSGSP